MQRSNRRSSGNISRRSSASRARRITRRPSAATCWSSPGGSASRPVRTRRTTSMSANPPRREWRTARASSCRRTSTWFRRKTTTRRSISRRTRSTPMRTADGSRPTARRSGPTTASAWLRSWPCWRTTRSRTGRWRRSSRPPRRPAWTAPSGCGPGCCRAKSCSTSIPRRRASCTWAVPEGSTRTRRSAMRRSRRPPRATSPRRSPSGASRAAIRAFRSSASAPMPTNCCSGCSMPRPAPCCSARWTAADCATPFRARPKPLCCSPRRITTLSPGRSPRTKRPCGRSSKGSRRTFRSRSGSVPGPPECCRATWP